MMSTQGQSVDVDDEEFCPSCFAGMTSSEHHEKCVRPLDLLDDIRVLVRENRGSSSKAKRRFVAKVAAIVGETDQEDVA